MSKSNHITAYHPTKGARRFSAGIWAAMGPDKQGFTEKAPMPDELKFPSGGISNGNAEGGEFILPSDSLIKSHKALLDELKQPQKIFIPSEGEILAMESDPVREVEIHSAEEMENELEARLLDAIKEDEMTVAANKELREMHQKGEVNATTSEEVAAVMETAIERAAAKKGRKPKAI